MRRYSVGVVGLGVAGATAAIPLARQGHKVTEFEQTGEPGAAGARVLPQPSGQMVVTMAGLRAGWLGGRLELQTRRAPSRVGNVAEREMA